MKLVSRLGRAFLAAFLGCHIGFANALVELFQPLLAYVALLYALPAGLILLAMELLVGRAARIRGWPPQREAIVLIPLAGAAGAAIGAAYAVPGMESADAARFGLIGLLAATILMLLRGTGVKRKNG